VTKHARVLLALLALVALAFVGCGGDDDDDAVGSGSGTTISDDDLEDAADAAGVDKECLAGVQAYSAFAASGSAAYTGGTDLEKSVDAFEAYAKKAPEAIRDDMKVLADAYSGWFQAIADSGWDPSSGKQPTPEQAQALSEAGAELDDEAVTTASNNVSSYFDEHCKASK
jgi:hypothetical protein